MTEKRISTTPVSKLAKAQGIDNAHALSMKAGIAYHTARRYWKDDKSMTRLETEVLLKLVIALECSLGDLLTIIDM